MKKKSTSKFIAKLCIWTIRKHELLSYYFKIYMWLAVTTILFFALVNVIALTTALNAIFFGGLSIILISLVLIENRRSVLLNIDDPNLKEDAQNAMMELIVLKKHKIHTKVGLFNRIRNIIKGYNGKQSKSKI
ncbi:conserved hypothetical protein [Candidatus Magnetomoraceae bacterium gMMP-15]